MSSSSLSLILRTLLTQREAREHVARQHHAHTQLRLLLRRVLHDALRERIHRPAHRCSRRRVFSEVFSDRRHEMRGEHLADSPGRAGEV